MTNNDVVRFTFRVPNVLMDKIRREAEKTGHSINALILQILWNWIREENKI